jgi:hypothetical protein
MFYQWPISEFFSVYGIYKKQAKRLRQTGGSLGGNDDDEDESLHEYMSCYIPKEGPDGTTTPEAKNLWGMYFFTANCLHFYAV